jgi:hypothetical protein
MNLEERKEGGIEEERARGKGKEKKKRGTGGKEERERRVEWGVLPGFRLAVCQFPPRSPHR